MPKSIDDVRNFWNSNPLYTGEIDAPADSKEFFEKTRDIFINDIFAGNLDERFFPDDLSTKKVLDLGCGVGMWVAEFGLKGCLNITGADLTPNSLKIAKNRCDAYGVKATLVEENAEELSFPDETFNHVNCSGVVHHTVHPEKAVSEIHRVIAKGGTAMISVYYKNFFLRHWGILRFPGKVLSALGAKLIGRGRDNIFATDDVNDLVRIYDGSENPIGLAYSDAEFRVMLSPYFEIAETYLHFFPARSLPFPIPKFMHRFLDKHFGFMIFATLRKK